MHTLRSMVFALLMLGFVPAAAFGQVGFRPCTTTANCPDGQSCQSGFLGVRQCLFEFCNVSGDCSRRGEVCTLGMCGRPGGSGGGGGSAGIGQSGEGGVCGPQRLGGGVIKNIGCRHGLQCRNGRCQRLLQ